MRTAMVLDALEMARCSRGMTLEGLVSYPDAGSQLTQFRYVERIAQTGAVPSIGSIGDCYDNALAETVNSLRTTELIRQQGPWRSIDDVEIATLSSVCWFNTVRLHGTLDDVLSTEYELAQHSRRTVANQPVESL